MTNIFRHLKTRILAQPACTPHHTTVLINSTNPYPQVSALDFQSKRHSPVGGRISTWSTPSSTPHLECSSTGYTWPLKDFKHTFISTFLPLQQLLRGSPKSSPSRCAILCTNQRTSTHLPQQRCSFVDCTWQLRDVANAHAYTHPLTYSHTRQAHNNARTNHTQ